MYAWVLDMHFNASTSLTICIFFSSFSAIITFWCLSNCVCAYFAPARTDICIVHANNQNKQHLNYLIQPLAHFNRGTVNKYTGLFQQMIEAIHLVSAAILCLQFIEQNDASKKEKEKWKPMEIGAIWIDSLCRVTKCRHAASFRRSIHSHVPIDRVLASNL